MKYFRLHYFKFLMLTTLLTTTQAYAQNYSIVLERLRLRPLNGDLDIYRTDLSLSNTTFSQTQSLSSHFETGWRFLVAKNLDDDDITISWLNIRTSHSLKHYIMNGSDMNLRYLSAANYPSYKNVYAHVSYDLDELYGVYGRKWMLTHPWILRIAGGLAYARLSSKLIVKGYANAGNYGEATSRSELTALGPRAEFDLVYQFLPYANLFANTHIVFLLNHQDTNFSDDITRDVEGTEKYKTIESYQNPFVVIPKIEMRLGVRYNFGGESHWTILAGWQVDAYIHAIVRREWDFSLSYPNVDQQKTSNFSDNTLFMGIEYQS